MVPRRAGRIARFALCGLIGLAPALTNAQVPGDRVRITMRDSVRIEGRFVNWDDSLFVLRDTAVTASHLARLEVWRSPSWWASIGAGALTGLAVVSADPSPPARAVGTGIGAGVLVAGVARLLWRGWWEELPLR